MAFCVYKVVFKLTSWSTFERFKNPFEKFDPCQRGLLQTQALNFMRDWLFVDYSHSYPVCLFGKLARTI